MSILVEFLALWLGVSLLMVGVWILTVSVRQAWEDWRR